jgi:predicted site-specific integrase-resolvase
MKRTPDLDIVGVPEIADRLGVSRARVAKWAERGLLRPPEWYVAGSKLWQWENVEQDARQLANNSRHTV